MYTEIDQSVFHILQCIMYLFTNVSSFKDIDIFYMAGLRYEWHIKCNILNNFWNIIQHINYNLKSKPSVSPTSALF